MQCQSENSDSEAPSDESPPIAQPINMNRINVKSVSYTNTPPFVPIFAEMYELEVDQVVSTNL